MRLRQVEIRNFRAINRLKLEELEDVVVIAGPNGCGKSCVLDAIRLLKSCYGGYQPNESEHWFSEFQINLGRSRDEHLALFQDRGNPLFVSFEVEISTTELDYIKSNIYDLVNGLIQDQNAGEFSGWHYTASTSLARELRTRQFEVEAEQAEFLSEIDSELKEDTLVGELEVAPNGNIRIRQSRLLELIFSVYIPKNIGVIDYHGAQRTYGREQVSGINLNIATTESTLRNHALYNYSGKYSNIKNEMAASYIRELLSQKAGDTSGEVATLTETLHDLFDTFFPGKQFLGIHPTIDGRLEFPVRTSTGAIHDINDLSSGEKELVYGYLRLRNNAPKNSVLLMDEPELHLNPRLLQGLPQFYHKYLGKHLHNQLWLVTHSDALLR